VYSVHLIDSKGEGSYLSVKGKTQWKTKKIAVNHAKDIKEAIDKGLDIWGTVIVEVENEFGELIDF